MRASPGQEARALGIEGPTVDPREVAKFARHAEDWWNPHGPMRPLHRLNPVRIAFIRDAACERFGREPEIRQPLAGLSLLDIGCGGGLICEPMRRLGAEVVGIDAGEWGLRVAAAHAAEQGLQIDYRVATAERLAESGDAFDIVLALEIVEHVPDRRAFLSAAAALVRPGGLFVLATLNRTPKSFLMAIVGAEYLLRWLPPGTHAYDKLVRPEEAAADLAAAGLVPSPPVGVEYDLFRDRFALGSDTGVNYMVRADRPAELAIRSD